MLIRKFRRDGGAQPDKTVTQDGFSATIDAQAPYAAPRPWHDADAAPQTGSVPQTGSMPRTGSVPQAAQAEAAALREENGRLGRYLAEQAESVHRIFCGLEQRLK